MRWLAGLALAAGALLRQRRQPTVPAPDIEGSVAVVDNKVGELAQQLAALGPCSCSCCTPLPTNEQCIVNPHNAAGTCSDPCIPQMPEVIVAGESGVELLRYCVVECVPEITT